MQMFQFRSYTLPTKTQMSDAINELADLLSLDRFTLPEIAERMEVSKGTVCVLLSQLCGLYAEIAAA